MSIIGQLNEQPLHAALKAFYTQPTGQTEVWLDGYLIDVVRGGELIEIQTGNFSTIKQKLTKLTQHQHQVRLVYPVAVEKWILKYPQEEGEEFQRRKSPKRGRPVAVFAELVSFPKLVLAPNFTLELAMIQEEEVRRYVDKRRWRRDGWETVERRLIKVLERLTFPGPDAFVGLLPPDLPEAFTTADIAAGLAIPKWLAQKMAYCLREMTALEVVGKQGRSWLYSL
ncbi:MAG: hypothetical protein ACNA8H_10005 [Anaerolineales bacterium]